MGCEGAERCELCGAPAAVHCAADAAFLCAACDGKVHGANFLASRHHRTRLAAAPDVEDGYESAASSCVSTADSAPPRRGRRPRRSRAEVVLEGWAKQMGLPTAAARRGAARAVRACGPDAVAVAGVPLRVAMAAALWREVAEAEVRRCGVHQGDALRRLEACAHVPARLVVAVASSVARARSRRRVEADAAEGWDECSWAGPNKSNHPPRP